ncbi:alpha/beta-hydrolase [Abortiporus biennis]|nr:alpha/beta-hydrolase [Abortiporus biennis]
MPFVDLLSNDDYVSLWFYTNTPYCNVGSFNPERPTIVMLHPLHLDSSWMYPQFDDPRLNNRYNLIAFDTRLTGKSRSKLTGKCDLWVHAADLAHAFYHLQLPPAHIFACDVYGQVALRFASLFPDLCLSLTLCNVGLAVETKTTVETMEELGNLWAYAEDLETFEYGARELLMNNVGTNAHADLQDELVAFWEMTYPPFRRANLISYIQTITNRAAMTSTELASITAPTLLIQADSNSRYPISYAEQLVKELSGVRDGAVLFPVKASLGIISIMSSSIVNQVFAKFLGRQPEVKSTPKPQRLTLSEFMSSALAKMAQFKHDSSYHHRDPTSPTSFSCVSTELGKIQEERILSYAKGERTAFSPLGPDGRPVRKFSERKDHWLEYGTDGYSYADKKVMPEDSGSSSKRRGKTSNGKTDQWVDIPPDDSKGSSPGGDMSVSEVGPSVYQLVGRNRTQQMKGKLATQVGVSITRVLR